MPSKELTHSKMLDLLARDFQIVGSAPDFDIDTGYYVYHIKMHIGTAIQDITAEFNATLWLKFSPQNNDQITDLRYRKGFSIARFTKRDNRGGMQLYKPRFKKVQNLSYGTDDGHFVMLEMPLTADSLLKDMHKFYIECYNGTQFFTELIRKELGDAEIAESNGVSLDRIKPPKPLRDTRYVFSRRIWLALFGLIALALFALNAFTVIGAVLALLSAAVEINLTARLIALLDVDNWFVRLLELIQSSAGEFLLRLIEGYRDAVRPVVRGIEQWLGYSLPNLVLDLIAALTAQTSSSFIAAFRRHLRKRKILIDNLEGAGAGMVRSPDMDRRHLEQFGLKKILFETFRGFGKRLIFFSVLIFLVLTVERKWAFVVDQFQHFTTSL